MHTAPFVFLSATEHARTGDLATVLDEAFDDNGPLDRDTRTQMLTGIAQRADINAKILTRILNEMPHEAWTLRAAILNNPVLRRAPKVHAQARSLHPDGFITLLADLDDADEYLPEFILAAHRHSMFPDIPQRVRDHFGNEAIRTVVDGLVARFLAALTAEDLTGYRDLYDLPQNAFLDADHITALALAVREVITAEADPHSYGATQGVVNAETILSRLLARTDLTVEHGHILLDALAILARTDVERDRLDAEHYGPEWQSRLGYSSVGRMLTNSALPQKVLVRALTDEHIYAILNDQRSTNLNIEIGTILDALRDGAPLSVLHRFHVHRMPADVLDLMLDRFDADRHTLDDATSRSTLTALVSAATDLIGSPQWDRLYDVWMNNTTDLPADLPTGMPTGMPTDLPADIEDLIAGGPGESRQDQFADLVERRAMRWSDSSAEPVLHRFAAWASTSPDPRLRRHAVKHIWTRAQMVAAITDPHPLVRAQALDHEHVPEDILMALAADPEAWVREAVASHRDATAAVLATMGNDPADGVRLAVANHREADGDTLRSLANDTNDAVRAVVAEKFLTAITRPA